jgi:hypothetical protein
LESLTDPITNQKLMKRFSLSTTALVENKEVSEQVEDPTKYNIKLLSHIQSTDIDPETKNKPYVVILFLIQKKGLHYPN